MKMAKEGSVKSKMFACSLTAKMVAIEFCQVRPTFLVVVELNFAQSLQHKTTN